MTFKEGAAGDGGGEGEVETGAGMGLNPMTGEEVEGGTEEEPFGGLAGPK